MQLQKSGFQNLIYGYLRMHTFLWESSGISVAFCVSKISLLVNDHVGSSDSENNRLLGCDPYSLTAARGGLDIGGG